MSHLYLDVLQHCSICAANLPQMDRYVDIFANCLILSDGIINHTNLYAESSKEGGVSTKGQTLLS